MVQSLEALAAVVSATALANVSLHHILSCLSCLVVANAILYYSVMLDNATFHQTDCMRVQLDPLPLVYSTMLFVPVCAHMHVIVVCCVEQRLLSILGSSMD